MVLSGGGGVDGHGDVQKNSGGQPLQCHSRSENIFASDKAKVRTSDQRIFVHCFDLMSVVVLTMI